MRKSVENGLEKSLHFILHTAILTVFFFVGWWQRVHAIPNGAYYTGFLIFVPYAIAMLAWILLGLPGLDTVFKNRLWWLIALVGLMLWALLSPQWSPYPNVAVVAAQQLTLGMLFAILTASAGPSPRAVTSAIVIGAVFQAVIVIAQVAVQRPVGLSALGEFGIEPGNVGLSIVVAGADRLMRPYGLTIHPNLIGGLFAVALLAMSGWLADSGLARWRRIVRGIAAALITWSLFLSFSRGAWGALLVAAVAIAISWRRTGGVPVAGRGSRLRFTVIGTAVLAILFGLSYSEYLVARAGVGGETTEQRSISDRRVYLEIAIQMIKQYPVAGVGVSVFPWIASDYLNTPAYQGIDLPGDFVHDLPLLIWSELGVVGLILWLLVLLIACVTIWRQTFDPFSFGLAAGVLALLAIGTLDHYPWTIFQMALLLWGCLGTALQPVAMPIPSDAAGTFEHKQSTPSHIT